MNVVITAHAKKEYGQNLQIIGQTFDGWKQLDYWFDLVVELLQGPQGQGTRGIMRACWQKSWGNAARQLPGWRNVRVVVMGDQGSQRCQPQLERSANTILGLGTPDQAADQRFALAESACRRGRSRNGSPKRARILEDMPFDAVQKCIAFVKGRFPNAAAAA